MTVQARPITALPDGSPLYPAEWAPPVDKSGDKPARPRFPGGGQGAVGGKPQSVRHQPTSRPKSDVGACLDGLVGCADGFPQAPPPRAPESAKQAELPAIQPPRVTANRCPPRNVGQYLSSLLKPDSKAQRRLRFERLEKARRILRGTPLASCMLYARDADKGVQLVSYDGAAGYRGWGHCGSRCCPWDAAKLAQKDAAKGEKFARGWVKRGNAIAMVHYTFRHSREEKPRETWEAHTKVLQRLHSGSKWRAFVKEFGLLEHFLGNEVTVGENGCHKHQHRCWEILWREEFRTSTGRKQFGKRMEAAYEALYIDALHAEGRDALPGIALKLTIAAPTNKNAAKAAEYVTKFAKETMQGGLKSGHKGNKTMFELVDITGDKSLPDDVRATARGQYADLYWGLKGKHWTYFSEAHVGDETAPGGEEEIPEPDLEDEGQDEVQISGMAAAMLASQRKQCWLLEYWEEHGSYETAIWLAEFTDPSHWSVEFLARFRQSPMVHWP